MTRAIRILIIAFLAAGCSIGNANSSPALAGTAGCDGRSVSALPIVVLPGRGKSNLPAIILSGDGGWRKIDERIAADLNAAGSSVVGLRSNEYFSKARTPAEAACDIDALIRHIASTTGKEKIVLIGYSRGADALPLIVNRLPQATRARVSRLVLLGPARTTQLHTRPWWDIRPDRAPVYQLLPELAGLRGIDLLCIYGERERDSLCPLFPKGSATVIRFSGGHHFGGAYDEVARRILQ